MITFEYDERTGALYAYKDGVLVGPITSMGDPPPKPDEPERNLRKDVLNNG